MSHADSEEPSEYHAWNPGLQSDIPSALWPLVTLFREENAFVSYSLARELTDLTGIKVLELAAFRPERLVKHALLIRVTADLSVPDGPNYEDLGINLRGMVETVFTGYLKPVMPEIVQAFEAEKEQAHAFITEQLSTLPGQSSSMVHESTPGADSKPSLLKRLLATINPVRQQSSKKQGGSSTSSAALNESGDFALISRWQNAERENSDPLQSACLNALIKTAETIVAHRGRLLPDAELLCRIAVNRVCNEHGAKCIDTWIEPHWQRAIKAEQYCELPIQEKPVVMNVKGASASGKSTIRPRQRELASKLGIPWEDFALISPDYWRKYLLDYASLGGDHKYGAMLTGRELEIIDKKLDRYMADKAQKRVMSHLLIDRFRFDSFSLGSDRTIDSRLLSRFGNRVYLFFMITHPAETVQRAWSRGLTTGRFKAVDDLLFHNVEAFTGMPSLFLDWVKLTDKKIHFEFLDNDVPKGELPRTAAFGWNNTLTILDLRLLLNIDRYRRVNISARLPEQIFNAAELEPEANLEFIKQCVNRVPEIVFADQKTAAAYARVEHGQLIWWDDHYLQQNQDSEGLQEVLSLLGYQNEQCPADRLENKVSIDVESEQQVTVGRWNDA